MYNYLEQIDDGLPMRPAGEWAAEKLDYVRRYIDVFETSMHTKWPIRNYIDLLAGPGKNRVRESGNILLGSPLIALNTKYPFTGYYFVDLDPKLTAALSQRCSASALDKLVHVETGDCNVIVNTITPILKLTENTSLNLSFLDPKGLELNWSTVAQLASVRRMDLVINYPEGSLNRCMAKFFDSPVVTSVDTFFGTNEWREIYQDYRRNNKRTGLHRELIDFYKYRLNGLGYQEVVRSDEVTGDEPLMRNTKMRAPLYRLIFASKNPLGQKFWHAVTRRDLYGQRRLFDGV